MTGLSVKQRKELRKFLARRKAIRLAKKSSNFNPKIFSGIKKVVKVGFWFFLLKGIVWLLIIYFGVKIF